MYAATMSTPSSPDYRERLRVTLDAAMYYRGITTDDLAQAVGVDAETARRWKRGATVPSAEMVGRLVLALDAPHDLLLYPPATRAAALAAMAAWDELRGGLPQ